MEIRNKRLSEDEFFLEREKVLALWPTGKEVDLDEAIEYHKNMHPSKVCARKFAEAKHKGKTLVYSLMGYTTIEQHIELLRYMQNEGHADILNTIVDSLTRTIHFEAAERELRKSEKTNENLLNGFPIVAHGVAGTRKVVESVDLPVQLAEVTTDPRLQTEIGLAGGHTSFGNTALSSWRGYSKDMPLETSICNHQYTCRLAGYYEEKGVPILVNAGSGIAVLPGIDPPSQAIASGIVNLLMVPEQGVKHISIYIISQGNLVQDIAVSIAHMKLAREYLDKFGYKDVELYLVNGCIGGSYPVDNAQAFAEVLYAPIVSVLTGAQGCLIKSFDEAATIPTKENNAFSIRGCKMMVNMLKSQKIDVLGNRKVIAEARMQEEEAKVIIDRVLELGDGDIAIGAIRAFESGVLDNATANNKNVRRRVMGVRDAEGAVRYLETGNLPFSKDMVEFHKRKITEREKATGRKVDYNTVVADVLALSRGSLLAKIEDMEIVL